MAKDPAVLFYIDNWLVSTKEMKADERGWYLNLILHQYDKGSLPTDLEELANLADVRFSEFETFKQKWKQVLKQKFTLNEEDRLENQKAKEILIKREKFKDKRSTAGTIGYVVKFAKNELNCNDSQIDFVKKNLEVEKVNIRDKQVLKQVLKDLLKLYININGNGNIIINEDSDLDKKKQIHSLQKFVSENLPNVSKLDKQLTSDQCHELLKNYPEEKIKDKLMSMENFDKTKKKKYTSVYLTCREWLKRDSESTLTNYGKNNGYGSISPNESVFEGATEF